MIPATFSYHAPTDVAGAVGLLADVSQSACLLAGGTWVVPELGRGDRRALQVIDLRHAGLRRLATADDGALEVGAMCTYADLVRSPLVRSHCRLLADMASQVTGGPQLRNQGTVGGSLAAARAGFDVPTTLVALDAVVQIAGQEGVRWLCARELLRGDRRTGLGPSEVLVAMRIPRRDDASYGYCKLKLSASSWPIVTAAAVVAPAGDHPASARVAIGGVAETPVVVELSAAEVTGPAVAGRLRERIAAESVAAPFADALAPARYRSAVAPTAASRALAAAVASAATEARSS
jgi:CO/xanthine dehydrogenase FAD-binding subunit